MVSDQGGRLGVVVLTIRAINDLPLLGLRSLPRLRCLWPTSSSPRIGPALPLQGCLALTEGSQGLRDGDSQTPSTVDISTPELRPADKAAVQS